MALLSELTSILNIFLIIMAANPILKEEQCGTQQAFKLYERVEGRIWHGG
jgi:hypothetical protein